MLPSTPAETTDEALLEEEMANLEIEDAQEAEDRQEDEESKEETALTLPEGIDQITFINEIDFQLVPEVIFAPHLLPLSNNKYNNNSRVKALHLLSDVQFFNILIKLISG